MLKTLSIILLSFILVGCAATNKAKFDVRTQQVAYKDLSNIKPPLGDPIITVSYTHLTLPTTPYV